MATKRSRCNPHSTVSTPAIAVLLMVVLCIIQLASHHPIKLVAGIIAAYSTALNPHHVLKLLTKRLGNVVKLALRSFRVVSLSRHFISDLPAPESSELFYFEHQLSIPRARNTLYERLQSATHPSSFPTRSLLYYRDDQSMPLYQIFQSHQTLQCQEYEVDISSSFNLLLSQISA